MATLALNLPTMLAQPTTPNQRSTQTFRGRSASLIGYVAQALAEKANPRVLSFGCSTGDECLDIAAAMPRATIMGCDIDPAALAKARTECAGRATIFESNTASVQARGPFDAIFALSVLCRYPASSGRDNVAAVYAFKHFDEGLRLLDRSLKPCGLLAIFNAQYFFEDSSIAPRYRPHDTRPDARNGWIEKATPNGLRATDVSYSFEGQNFSRQDWSVFIKANRARVEAQYDRLTYRHTWRSDKVIRRSTTVAIWQKQ